MEEKERYKWSQDVIVECPYEDCDYIVDTENNIIFDDDNYFKLVDLLNQQDKRIKELETCLDEEIESNVNLYNLRLKTEQESQQLKQQVKELQNQEETYAKFACHQFEENKLRYNKLNKELTKQVQELQEKLHILNEQSQNNYYRERYTEALKENNQLDKRIEELEEENQQLKQQLAITGKALQMACERVKYFEEMQDKEMGFYDLFGYENKYDLGAIIKQYKQQAKEMLENE